MAGAPWSLPRSYGCSRPSLPPRSAWPPTSVGDRVRPWPFLAPPASHWNRALGLSAAGRRLPAGSAHRIDRPGGIWRLVLARLPVWERFAPYSTGRSVSLLRMVLSVVIYNSATAFADFQVFADVARSWRRACPSTISFRRTTIPTPGHKHPLFFALCCLHPGSVGTDALRTDLVPGEPGTFRPDPGAPDARSSVGWRSPEFYAEHCVADPPAGSGVVAGATRLRHPGLSHRGSSFCFVESNIGCRVGAFRRDHAKLPGPPPSLLRPVTAVARGAWPCLSAAASYWRQPSPPWAGRRTSRLFRDSAHTERGTTPRTGLV